MILEVSVRFVAEPETTDRLMASEELRPDFTDILMSFASRLEQLTRGELEFSGWKATNILQVTWPLTVRD